MFATAARGGSKEGLGWFVARSGCHRCTLGGAAAAPILVPQWRCNGVAVGRTYCQRRASSSCPRSPAHDPPSLPLLILIMDWRLSIDAEHRVGDLHCLTRSQEKRER
ncbi:hypothetical protein ACP70R_010623 [Stipagrostis hirtigluma subsp. patula]